MACYEISGINGLVVSEDKVESLINKINCFQSAEDKVIKTVRERVKNEKTGTERLKKNRT